MERGSVIDAQLTLEEFTSWYTKMEEQTNAHLFAKAIEGILFGGGRLGNGIIDRIRERKKK